ncbi:DUF7167 family protein [Desulfovibrio falkowii]|uniref:DUF7167 family protein n=1 Tax=Desulfovibrio sp. WGS1351 TaxID=3366814 RepID=UPI00372D4C00
MAKVKVCLDVGLVGCSQEETVEIADAEWAGMSEDEREEYCKEVMFSLIEWYWEEE